MDAPILRLTSTIKPGETAGVFIGRVNEITGIIAQGSSREEVHDDLVKIAGSILEYKQEEAIALLRKQTEEPIAVAPRKFRLKYEILELEVA